MENPLASDDPDVWGRLVDAVNPASLMVVIARRLEPELRRVLAPEDILQDTLAKAWRARATFEWQGLPRFRRWLLRIAERCVEDERERARARKRGGDGVTPVHSPTAEESAHRNGLEPWSSTTPSRIAVQRERLHALEQALDSLPEEVREVVHLRLFEDLMLDEIAARLGLGLSAVRHRFRRGAQLYRQRLRLAIGESGWASPETSTDRRSTPEKRGTCDPGAADPR